MTSAINFGPAKFTCSQKRRRKKGKHCHQQNFAYKEAKGADSNAWCHFWS